MAENKKVMEEEARAKVFECMMTPPKAAAAWNMEVLGEELRDIWSGRGIRFRKINDRKKYHKTL